MSRGLIEGIPDRAKIMKQIRNSEYEDTILRQYPIHEARSVGELLHYHNSAVQMLFNTTPENLWLDVLGRLDRKLVKRAKHLKK